jgi:hypothetical protein
MPDKMPKGNAGTPSPPADSAISQIVQMDPRRVTVTLPLPVHETKNKPPMVTLEWTREDTTMPLGQLLQRIESYTKQYGAK